jgi:hypothetical protein
MANNVQANWNVVKIVYDFGDATIGWLTKNVHVCSTRLNRLINILNN